jgi:hypothetical protein
MYLLIDAETCQLHPRGECKFGLIPDTLPGTFVVARESKTAKCAVHILGSKDGQHVVAIEHFGGEGYVNFVNVVGYCADNGLDEKPIGIIDGKRAGLGKGRIKAEARKRGWL